MIGAADIVPAGLPEASAMSCRIARRGHVGQRGADLLPHRHDAHRHDPCCQHALPVDEAHPFDRDQRSAAMKSISAFAYLALRVMPVDGSSSVP